ncbi:M16 family metallopeptidase [Streptomyces rhizosphaerihabitans]|uniref:M16 family metallopeptidase n=1 Tax=Streptomyces rhizosphaerihabitans TaxID=1266770 RepID=UPI0021C09F94|nr:insulinase family protein [Streptomyces rhizosphaerihabitans]MCT9011739.1 insulinase family protein [Streptomyces rhizosphaerihabitans]
MTQPPTTPAPTTLRLENGLRVLLQPLPGCQVVATCLHVGTGFRNEPVAGAAHLLEHVLAQGASSSRPLTDAVAATGGTTNARTAADYTQYTAVLPAGTLDLALRIEHERLTDPDFGPGHISAQIAVVQAEIRRNMLQRPHGGLVLFDLPALLHDTWENRHNGYGDIEALHDLGPAELHRFFLDSYAPGNVHLALAGDFDPQHARDLVEHHLSPLPPRPAPPRPHTPEAPLTAPRRAQRAERIARTARTALGFRTPDPVTEPGAHLATVLLGELLETLGTDCACHPGARRTWGAFRTRAHRTGNPFDVARDALFAVDFPHPAGTDPDEAEHCLRTVLATVADARVPLTGPLARIRRQLALALHAELDSVASQASWLCIGAAVHDDPLHLAGLPGALHRLPDTEVSAAAARCATAPAARLTSLPTPATPPATLPVSAAAPARTGAPA